MSQQYRQSTAWLKQGQLNRLLCHLASTCKSRNLQLDDEKTCSICNTFMDLLTACEGTKICQTFVDPNSLAALAAARVGVVIQSKNNDHIQAQKSNYDGGIEADTLNAQAVTYEKIPMHLRQ